MRKFLKVLLTLSLIMSMLLNMFCITNAEDIVEYVPDDKFILTTKSIKHMIGKRIKLNFKVPNENSENPLEYILFPEGLPKPDDIVQGNAGLCYLLAPLISIVNSQPEIIKNAMTDNEDGTVTIKLYDLLTAQPRYIKVDKTIPDLPRICAILDKECLWVELMIKALMAIGLEERACLKTSSEMKYKCIEGGLMHPVLKMITGKDCSDYKDIDILKKSNDKIFNMINDSFKSGSGIITCDFNSNRFASLGRSMLRFPASKNGLVYAHAYSVVNAFEDESKQKWIVVKNPWASFNATYKDDKISLEMDDSKSQGYSVIKLKDFCSRCSSIQIVNQDTLKPMNFSQKFREFTYKRPFITGTSLLIYSFFYTLIRVNTELDLTERGEAFIYAISLLLTQLILW